VLGVANILEGSVRKAGNRIRATAQLIDASNGSHLWSERYDREMTDVFAIQDEISQAIAEKLRVRLSGHRPLVKRHTESLEAYNLCLKGGYHFKKATPESVLKSREYYEQAIAADPNFAMAWFGLALFYWGLGYIGAMSQKAANKQSAQAARKAVELDETLAEAHCILGVILANGFDWQGAESEFRLALELDPDISDIWFQYGMYYLLPMQRLNEAVAALQKAQQLDPLSPILQCCLGLIYFAARKYDHAVEQLRSALELDPHHFMSHMFLGITWFATGKLDEGIHACETALQLAGDFPYILGFLASAHARTGRIDEAKKLLGQLQDRAQRTYVPPFSFAVIYFGLGEIDKGFDYLEQAVEDQDFRIQNLVVSPLFDPMRSHPRFQALLRKMNLEP
jgi:tetratricopeptide (TPR) repeat protein